MTSRAFCKGTAPKREKPKKPSMSRHWIPHAPTGQKNATIVEKDLQEWREMLDNDFPIMSPEEIARVDQAFHMLLLHDMIAAGDASAAQEIHTLLRKEDREKMRCHKIGASLRDQHERLEGLARKLKICHDHIAAGDHVAAIEVKKKLAEEAVKSGDAWMARHFLLSSLTMCRQLSDTFEEEGKDFTKWSKIQAELHCLLAFLARESNETLENVLALAIDHLAICRQLSKGQHWQFKPKVITIRLKRPIALHGLRTEGVAKEDEIYDVVDGCSMPMYMIATLLEHELLISLANQIMHSHRAPTDEDLRVAHEFADHALKLALEVRQPTAMSSAYVRFGLVLRHSGAYDDALTYFTALQHNAGITADILTEGIAYHNIGLCLLGCHNSPGALENFAKQLDLATEHGAKDLEADAMYELGHLFLQEGYMWEAEECYTISFEDFASMHHTNSHSLAAWSMLGVAAGQKTWGRFAALCRHNRTSDFYTLLAWKCSRAALRMTHRPSYRPIPISKAWAPYVKKMQVQPRPVPIAHHLGEDLEDPANLSDTSFHEVESREKYDPEKIKERYCATRMHLGGSVMNIGGSRMTIHGGSRMTIHGGGSRMTIGGSRSRMTISGSQMNIQGSRMHISTHSSRMNICGDIRASRMNIRASKMNLLSGDVPPDVSASQVNLRGSIPLLGSTSKTKIGKMSAGEEHEDEDEEEHEHDGEEEDEEGTELDASQLEVDEGDQEYVDPDPDELPGYTRYKARRASSTAMIGEEMFIKVRKPSIPPPEGDDSEEAEELDHHHQLLKDIDHGWKEHKGKSKKKKLGDGEEGEEEGEGKDEEDKDSDDDDYDDHDEGHHVHGHGHHHHHHHRHSGEWTGEGGIDHESAWRREVELRRRLEWGGEGGYHHHHREWMGEGQEWGGEGGYSFQNTGGLMTLSEDTPTDENIEAAAEEGEIKRKSGKRGKYGKARAKIDQNAAGPQDTAAADPAAVDEGNADEEGEEDGQKDATPEKKKKKRRKSVGGLEKRRQSKVD